MQSWIGGRYLAVQQLLSMIQSGEIHREAILKDNLFMDILLQWLPWVSLMMPVWLTIPSFCDTWLGAGVVAISSRLTSSRLGGYGA